VDYITAVREPSRPRDAYFFRAESYFNVATEIERLDEDPDGGGPPIIDSYGGVSLHEQSHGESFFSTFLHRFGGSGLYILDEPEAALSPMRQFAMLSRLHQLVKLQSQFVIATHSPILMSYPDAVILEITDKGLRKSSLEETEHFKLSQAFFADPRRMLEMLMEVS
jgi:predicted ATPase